MRDTSMTMGSRDSAAQLSFDFASGEAEPRFRTDVKTRVVDEFSQNDMSNSKK